MERKIHESLMHLTDDEIEKLIKRYYQGENVKKLIKEYKIDARHNYIVGLFPSPKSSKMCPYCNVNLSSTYKSRTSLLKIESHCPICNHYTETYNCNCTNCKSGARNRSKNDRERTQAAGDLKFKHIEDELHSKRLYENSKSDDRMNQKRLLRSGITEFDRRFEGFMPSSLNIISGRHSMGKTTLCLWICYYLKFKENANIAIFSMEMSKNQVLKRLGSAHFCTLETPTNNHFDHNTLTTNFNFISNSFVVRSAPQFNTNDIYEMVLKDNANCPIDFIFIDNIHRMSLSPEDRIYAVNREQEISKIVRDLKSLAMRLKIPILAISQINRDIEFRPGHFPMIQDLKDSGTIENDADFVFFVHRPEIYGITEDEDGNNLRGLVEISIAKNKFGYTTPYVYNMTHCDKFAFNFSKLTSQFC